MGDFLVFELNDGAKDNNVSLKAGKYGHMLFLQKDLYVGRSLDLYGEFSELETDLFRQLVQKGMSVVEVGANIGAHTVSLAQMVGPTGKVYAYEPQRAIFHILCANLAINSIYNVYAKQIGIGAESGFLNIPPLDYTAVNNFGGLSLSENSLGETVQINKLDDEQINAAHFLKIDVEGMEESVLNGASGLISRNRPIIYLENDRQDKSKSLILKLQKLGYKAWWHTPELFNPNNFYKENKNVFPGIVSINLLCIPEERPVNLSGFKQVLNENDWWS